jgi:hypothetical protein
LPDPYRGAFVDYDFQADEMKLVLPRLNTVFNEKSHLIRMPYISTLNPSLPVDAERVTSIFLNQQRERCSP